MTTRTNKRKDFSQVAFNIVQQATGEVTPKPELTKAQESGKKGGKIGGATRAKKMTAKERSEAARKAATARWGNN
jgi:hypothetical protein